MDGSKSRFNDCSTIFSIKVIQFVINFFKNIFFVIKAERDVATFQFVFGPKFR